MLYYLYLDRGFIHQNMAWAHEKKHEFTHAYVAADRAKGDYESALSFAEALGWKGLAEETRGFLERLEVHQMIIRQQEKSSKLVE